jgi:hypothetical protein
MIIIIIIISIFNVVIIYKNNAIIIFTYLITVTIVLYKCDLFFHTASMEFNKQLNFV